MNNNTKYLKLIISKLFNIGMDEDFILLNAELPSNNSNIKSSYCDLILKNKNKEYIIEMNGSPYSDLTFYKNHHYLFKEHTSRNYKGNIYGKNNYTILINIDNYNLLKKDSLKYKSVLKYEQYEYMDVLKLEERFIATYDREEYEKGLQEEFENNKQEFENKKQEFENNKQELENNKIEIAREFKILGMPIEKIVKLTKLNADKIMSL